MFGASADTVQYNQEFADDKNYAFPLICDTKLALIKPLGIQLGDRPLPQRVTFVIDKQGKIAKIYEKVSPKGHAAEVLKFVKTISDSK